MERMQALIRHYKLKDRPRIDQEDRWFARQPSLADAIRLAALAKDWRGKRLPHGNRLRSHQLRLAEAALLGAEAQIAASKTFDELHAVISASLGGIWKNPELFCYDTSLRIGAKLGLMPQKVYLHRGTRVGARKLGMNTRAGFLTTAQLPPLLRCLEPREVEDFLCIFKHKF